MDSQIDPVECTVERGSSKIIASELVVAGGDTPPIFNAAEVSDFVSPPVEALAAIGFPNGGTAVRDDRQSAFVLDLLPHFFAVVGLVCRDGQRRSGCIQYLLDDLAVMDMSARQSEVQWPAFAVDNRVDLCGSAAPTDTDRLIFLPPFAPLAARWAFTIVLSIR